MWAGYWREQQARLIWSRKRVVSKGSATATASPCIAMMAIAIRKENPLSSLPDPPIPSSPKGTAVPPRHECAGLPCSDFCEYYVSTINQGSVASIQCPILSTSWVGLLALVFALTLSFLPFAAPAHAAAGTGRIYGQLLDGTKHDAPVVGQSVTLQMAQGNNTRDLLNVTTDAHGEFSFSGLDTDKTINYAVYTLYQGAQYYTDLIDLSSKPVQQINLKVYDATTSTANIAIVQATVLVDKVDAQNGLITISENYFFENLGLTSYVGSLQANGSKPNALLFALPTGARKLSLSSSFNGYQAIQVDTGFATNTALPPATSPLAFSFQVPYTATGYNFSYTIVYPTVDLSLLVPLNIHTSSSGMDSQGPVNVNQQTYQLFKAQKLLAGDQIHVQLQGLPAPQNAASPAPRNQNTLWIIVAILLILAIVRVTWFVSLLSPLRPTTTPKQPTRCKH